MLAQGQFLELVRAVRDRTTANLDGIHGEAHWRRVAALGLDIAEAEAADAEIVVLFGLLHDALRENDGDDPQHGPRAARLAADLAHKGLLPLSGDRLIALSEALFWHDRGQVTDHPTIGACWDADRLDLVRVGARPKRRLLSTATAQQRPPHRHEDPPSWSELAARLRAMPICHAEVPTAPPSGYRIWSLVPTEDGEVVRLGGPYLGSDGIWRGVDGCIYPICLRSDDDAEFDAELPAPHVGHVCGMYFSTLYYVSMVFTALLRLVANPTAREAADFQWTIDHWERAWPLGFAVSKVKPVGRTIAYAPFPGWGWEWRATGLQLLSLDVLWIGGTKEELVRRARALERDYRIQVGFVDLRDLGSMAEGKTFHEFREAIENRLTESQARPSTVELSYERMLGAIANGLAESARA